jgi:GNAT superfamily N-acetyltransferase
MGRTVWFTPESYALAADASPELLRDLYAAQAEAWVEQGYFNHYVMVPAGSPLLDAWLQLGFAYQQVYALLDLHDVEDAPPVANLEFRQAEPHDAPELAAIAHLTAGHQTRSPVFAPAPPDYIDELRSGYAELAGDSEAAATWLARRDGELVGIQSYFADPAGDHNLLSNEGWVELASAATLPTLRGTGIGRALTARGLQWATGAGYSVCLTDWRAANLPASRFWPRRGFMPVYYRLERRIDPRVLWARVAG